MVGPASTLQLIRHASMVPIVKVGLAPYVHTSDWTTPFGWEDSEMYGLTANLSGLPWAEEDVHVIVRASAHLGTESRFVTFRYNEASQNMLIANAGNCSDPPDEELLVIPAFEWNAQLQPEGADTFQMEIRIEPSPLVLAIACHAGYDHLGLVQFQLTYTEGTVPDTPESIGWRTFAPVLRDDGTMGHLEGEWKFDPVTGCLVVQIESQGKVTYGGLNASPKVPVAGRPGNGCVESYSPYEIRGSVVRFSTEGVCPEE